MNIVILESKYCNLIELIPLHTFPFFTLLKATPVPPGPILRAGFPHGEAEPQTQRWLELEWTRMMRTGPSCPTLILSLLGLNGHNHQEGPCLQVWLPSIFPPVLFYFIFLYSLKKINLIN